MEKTLLKRLHINAKLPKIIALTDYYLNKKKLISLFLNKMVNFNMNSNDK